MQSYGSVRPCPNVMLVFSKIAMTFSTANSHLNPTSIPFFKFWSDSSLGCPLTAHSGAVSAFSRVKFICNANIFALKNGLATIRRVRLRNLGCTKLEKNGTNFADFGFNDRVNPDVPVEEDNNGAYVNGFETFDGINRGRILDCINLEKNDTDSSRLRSNITANSASSTEKEVSALVGNGSGSFEETDADIGSGQGVRGGLEGSPDNDSDNKLSASLAIDKKIYSPYSYDPLKSKKDSGLLDEEELEKLKILENYEYRHSFEHGLFVVKVMGNEHMKDTEELLTDSFAELMWGPLTYRPLLRLTLREHMLERRALIPHAATLVGLYAQEQSKWMLAGTVELSFDSKGSVDFPPTPIPPRGAPYLCNMAVNKNLRRRSIGWHLLKASEELIPKMGSNEIYLHCRMIDKAPFNMYKKAGYNVVETDNILIILTLQRRRHLMYKKLLGST